MRRWPFDHLTVEQAWNFVRAADRSLFIQQLSSDQRAELAALSAWGAADGNENWDVLLDLARAADLSEPDNMNVRRALQTVGRPPFELESRPPDRHNVSIVQARAPGETIRTSLELGDTAILQHNGVAIHVRLMDITRAPSCAGAVHGFDSGDVGPVYNGLAVDDPIEFDESHVINGIEGTGCSAPG